MLVQETNQTPTRRKTRWPYRFHPPKHDPDCADCTNQEFTFHESPRYELRISYGLIWSDMIWSDLSDLIYLIWSDLYDLISYYLIYLIWPITDLIYLIWSDLIWSIRSDLFDLIWSIWSIQSDLSDMIWFDLINLIWYAQLIYMT